MELSRDDNANMLNAPDGEENERVKVQYVCGGKWVNKGHDDLFRLWQRKHTRLEVCDQMYRVWTQNFLQEAREKTPSVRSKVSFVKLVTLGTDHSW